MYRLLILLILLCSCSNNLTEEDIRNGFIEYFWEQWDQEIRPIALDKLYFSKSMLGVGKKENVGPGPAILSAMPPLDPNKDKWAEAGSTMTPRGRTPYGLPIGPNGVHTDAAAENIMPADHG